MKKINIIIFFILLALVLLNIKLITDSLQTSNQQGSSDLDSLQKKYPFVATRVLVDDTKDRLINFIPLRKALRDEVVGYEDNFSIYFEYLPTGVSIGINERTEFDSASLIKVPVAMAFLNAYRKAGLDINEKVRITKDELDDKFGDLWKRGEGAEISLKEALSLLLTESDNTAYKILNNRLTLRDHLEVYEKLDIEIGVDNNRQVILTTKGYSSILKALYFSSLLEKEDSEYILELLTQSIHKDKLPAPIPKEIPIAHKIGVYTDETNALYQDCGIVYVPRRPYILCMASLSTDAEATARMNKISEIVYRYVTTAD